MDYRTACSVVAAADIPLEVYLINAFDRSGSTSDITATTDQIYVISGVLALVEFLLWVATGIVFISLLWRMTKNGHVLNQGRAKHKSHWAITGWFVPFLNLARPYDMVKQVWTTSPPPPPGPFNMTPPGYFKVWWGLFLATGFLRRVAAALTPDGFITMKLLSDQAIWNLIAQIFTVATGVAFFSVIQALIKRHETALQVT